MAITGLLLCGFLVAHLAGNLLLYVPDGGQSYNEYAHALHKQVVLLAIAEFGLAVLFVAHIIIAIQVSAENRAARKVGCAMTRSKQEGRYVMEGYRPDTWMLATGIIVLGFLILHLMDFKFEIWSDKFYKTEAGSKLEPFDKAKALLSPSNMITIVGYVIGSLALLAHLAHGFQSAFQTLGINHPKYTPLIKFVGLLFAIAIGVGFATFPLAWAWRHGESPPKSVQASPAPQVWPTAATKSPAAAARSKKKSNIEHSIILLDEPTTGTLKGVDDPRID